MRIACILFPGFTALDLLGPATAWGMLPGAEFQTIWRDRGPVGLDMGLEMVATHDFTDCWQEPDVLLVPGGGSGVFRALEDDRFLDGIGRLGAGARWITSVCTGSLLLGAAGLLQGYRAACYWYARDQLAAFGAIPEEGRVVIDRNRASGGGVTAGIDFGLTMVGRWHGEDVGRQVELLLEYAPDPPFGSGRPELADAATRAAAAAILRDEMPRQVVGRTAVRRGLPSGSHGEDGPGGSIRAGREPGD